jgi:hypothetical protein
VLSVCRFVLLNVRLGLGEGRSEVLQSLSFPKSSNYTHKVVVYVPEDSLDNMRSALAEIGVGVQLHASLFSSSSYMMALQCGHDRPRIAHRSS